VFETACLVASGVVPATGGEAERLALIDFNRSYAVGYGEGGADGWTDARTGATVTPVDRLISFASIGDGRLFEVFDADPRGNDNAVELAFTENQAGILLNEAASTVWMTWVPETVKFSNASWLTATTYAVGDARVNPATGHCYRCLTAHTSGTFATDLAANKWLLIPVLAVLEEFLYAHVQGCHLLRTGQEQTGFGMQQKPIDALAVVAGKEIKNRLQT
jgi:hypothetical protein